MGGRRIYSFPLSANLKDLRPLLPSSVWFVVVVVVVVEVVVVVVVMMIVVGKICESESINTY